MRSLKSSICISENLICDKFNGEIEVCVSRDGVSLEIVTLDNPGFLGCSGVWSEETETCVSDKVSCCACGDALRNKAGN